MSKGFDCATQLTAPAANMFRRDGYDFVARYLVPERYTKYLSKSEADAIKSSGLWIVSVYESYADRALEGYDAGYADGQTAAQCAVNVGQPAGSAIYTAVDFEATDDQMQTVIAYVRGFNDATPDYATGVYGSYSVCQAVREAGAASRSWQTYAWSGGQKYDCQIYQYENGKYANGIDYDENESYGGEGWWGQEEVVFQPEAPQPEPAYSNDNQGAVLTVIGTWLKPAYQDAVDAGDTDQAGYIAWLAAKLREGVGLPQDAE